MSAIPQIRVLPQPLPGPQITGEEGSNGDSVSTEEGRIVPVPAPLDNTRAGNTLQVLRDAIARLNSSSEFGDQAELADLLTDARGALERAKLIAQCAAQCEDFLRENHFEQAFEALDAGLLVYPADPALSARLRDAEARQKTFLATAAVRAALDETQWLLDQARPDLACQFLSKKVVELPAEPDLQARLTEIEALLRDWEQNRFVHAALERALALEERQQWAASLAVLEEALRQHPASAELLDAAKRVRDGQLDQERKKRLARRLELIRQRISEHGWGPALTLVLSAQKEFPEAKELALLRREAEDGLQRSECEAVITEVRQHLADDELELAEKALRKGFSSQGREPALEALRKELEGEKEYREGLRNAQVLFGRRQLQEAESILARLVVKDRPEAQALLETVRQTRTASEEEKFFTRGRESALEMLQSEQFGQAADVLRNLLSLFPGNPILERDLKTAESSLARKSAAVTEAAVTEAKEKAAREAEDLPFVPTPRFGDVTAEESPAANRRRLFIGIAAFAAVSFGVAGWQFSRGSSPAAGTSAKPVLTSVAVVTAAPPAPIPAAAPVQEAPNQTLSQTQLQTSADSRATPAASVPPVAAQPQPPTTPSARPPKAFVPPEVRPTPASAERAVLPALAQEVVANVSVQSLPGLPPELGGLGGLPGAPPAEPAGGASLAAPPPPATVPRPIGGKFEEAQLVSHILPAYPSVARQRGIFGVVRLEGSIDERGNVKSVKVMTGDPFLAAAASSAVMRWKYKPATLNGKPVAVKAQIQVSFDK